MGTRIVVAILALMWCGFSYGSTDSERMIFKALPPVVAVPPTEKNRPIVKRVFTADAAVGYAPEDPHENFTRITIDVESKKPDWKEGVSDGSQTENAN